MADHKKIMALTVKELAFPKHLSEHREVTKAILAFSINLNKMIGEVSAFASQSSAKRIQIE